MVTKQAIICVSDDLLCNHWITVLDTASGICHLAQAIKGDVDGLLKGVADKTVIEEVKRVLEMVLQNLYYLPYQDHIFCPLN